MKKSILRVFGGAPLALVALVLANTASATITYNVATTYESDPLGFNFTENVTFQTDDTCYPNCGVSDILAGSQAATMVYSGPNTYTLTLNALPSFSITSFTTNGALSFSDPTSYGDILIGLNNNSYDVYVQNVTDTQLLESSYDFNTSTNYPSTQRTALNQQWTITEVPASPSPASVPEPASLSLLGIGLIGLGVRNRKRKAQG